MKLHVLLLSAAVLALSSTTVISTIAVSREILYNDFDDTPDESYHYQVIDEEHTHTEPNEYDGIDRNWHHLNFRTQGRSNAGGRSNAQGRSNAGGRSTARGISNAQGRSNARGRSNAQGRSNARGRSNAQGRSNALIDAEDERFIASLDSCPRTNTVVKRFRRQVGRFRFLRAFFGQFNKDGITRSGQRITKHYFKKGSYGEAVNVFRSLNPANVKTIDGSKFQGLTGTICNIIRVTVRSGSKKVRGVVGPPTLSIATKSGNFIRKFRFMP